MGRPRSKPLSLFGQRFHDALGRSRFPTKTALLKELDDVPAMTLHRYEVGGDPPMTLLTRLADALGVTTDYLVGRDALAPTTSEPIHDEALLDMVAQVVLELQIDADIERALRAHPWSGGLPSYGTLRSYAVDLMGQRSGKLKPAPTTKVDVGEGMKREPRAKRRD